MQAYVHFLGSNGDSDYMNSIWNKTAVNLYENQEDTKLFT